MTFGQQISAKKDFLQTLLLHLLAIFILCWLSYNIFLFIFPPLLFFWLSLSLILSLQHLLISKRVLIHYFRDDLLVQIWLNPLLLMAGWFTLTLIAIIITDLVGRADIWRQLLQIPVIPFSRVTFVFFVTIILSAVFLFTELSLIWLPRLQRSHFNRRNQYKSRFALTGLLLLMLIILFYLSFHKKENIVYITATIAARFGHSPQEAIAMFEKIPAAEERLYFSALYRIARIYLTQEKDFAKAKGYFQIIMENKDSPLRDDAFCQYLQCLILLEEAPSELIQSLQCFHQDFSYSTLLDDASFLIAKELVNRQLWSEAANIYSRLSQYPFWSYSLSLHYNRQIQHFHRTHQLAQNRLNELHGRI